MTSEERAVYKEIAEHNAFDFLKYPMQKNKTLHLPAYGTGSVMKWLFRGMRRWTTAI